MSDDHIITSAGKADRIAITATAFVSQLRDDKRVQQAYRDWREVHGLSRISVRDVEAIKKAVCRDADRDLKKLRAFMVNDLGLQLSWLPEALLIDFVAKFQGEVASIAEARRDVTFPTVIEAPSVPDLPRGKAPKNSGEYITRDVEWFYRAKVKNPPDTVYLIATEHQHEQLAAGINQGGLNHSKVQNAIARVEDLLDHLGPGIAGVI